MQDGRSVSWHPVMVNSTKFGGSTFSGILVMLLLETSKLVKFLSLYKPAEAIHAASRAVEVAPDFVVCTPSGSWINLRLLRHKKDAFVALASAVVVAAPGRPGSSKVSLVTIPAVYLKPDVKSLHDACYVQSGDAKFSFVIRLTEAGAFHPSTELTSKYDY